MDVLLNEIQQVEDHECDEPFLGLLPTAEESREALVHLGIPGERIPGCSEEVDLVGLVCSLDRLFATGCGHAGVKWFLREPDPELGGRAPADLIDKPKGVERIRQLVAREIELAHG